MKTLLLYCLLVFGCLLVSNSALAVIPNLAYSSPVIVTVGVPFTITPTNVGGGTPTSVTVGGGLPGGWVIGNTTGVITGTPTAGQIGTATYTITATRTGSGTQAPKPTITITVVAAPVFSYNSPNIFTTGVAIPGLSPTITSGGPIASYAISPGLPGGLTFNTTSGAVSGTPSVTSGTTTYTITATSSVGGTGTANFTIQVVSPPVFTYSSPNVYTTGFAITALSPTGAGTPLTAASISPALPAGLSISATGVISGTPAAAAGVTVYTITATGSNGGTGTANVSITVNDPAAPAITYSSPNTFIVATGITPLSPTSSGGPVASYAAPSLPAGLSINTANGVISGTPTTASAAANYNVTATNVTSSSTFPVNITINLPPPPVITYNTPNVFITGVLITSLNPTNSGGTPVSYSISPALPTGLAFNTGTGIISGTPTAVTVATDYIVTAANAGGNGTFTVNITTNPPAPVISYSPATITYRPGTAITTLTPANTGGASTSFSISPALPAGLSFNAINGAISGTPTAVSAATPYTIIATNPGGMSSTTETIAVMVPPAISYTPSTNVFLAGIAISPLAPANSGGAVPSFAFDMGTALTGATLNTPYGVGTNPVNGNIYVTNSGNGTISYYNSAGVYQGTFNSGFNTPVGIVFDSSGNAYIADRGTNVIYKVTTAGVKSTIATGFTSLRGISIDASNNLYVVSGGGNAVYKYNTSGTRLLTFDNTYTAYPTGAAVDAAGNIYVVDRTNNNVVKYNSSGVYLSTFATGFNGAYAIAIGGDGNVYVSDTGNNVVKAFDSSGTLLTSITGFNSNFGVVVDSQGNLITVDQGATTVLKYTIVGGYAISSPLPSGLSFDKNTGIISGTPAAAFSATVYTITAINAAGNATTTVTLSCVYPPLPAISYTPSTNVYTLGTAITPLAPANSGGAVALFAFGAGTALTGATLNTPYGMGINPVNGNIYVTNSGNATISFYNAAGAYQGTFSTGFNTPVGIVFDSSGNAYIADRGTSVIYKVTAAGVKSTIATGFTSLRGIAIDASNNLYVVSGGGNAVYKYNTSGTRLLTFDNTYTSYPTGAAVDALGNVYVIDRTNNNIVKYTSGGVYVSTLATGLNGPYAIAVDKDGNIYASDTGDGLVNVYNSAGTLLTSVTGFNSNYGVAVDSQDNLFAVDQGATSVLKFPLTGGYTISSPLPAGLNFDKNTGIISGTPTATSPVTTYTITAHNAAGSANTTITLSCVNPPLPAISYTPSINVYPVGNAISPLTPANSGGAVASFAFGTGTALTGATLNTPYGTGINPVNGNIYVTNSGNGTISYYNSAGVYQGTFSTGFNTPVGIVFDSSGNAYIADRGTNVIYKVTAAGVKSTIATGFTSLRGISIDASNNLYVSSGGGNAVYKYNTAGTRLLTLNNTNTAYPTGTVVDASGNIYVVDRTNNNVVEYNSSGVYMAVFASGFNGPYAIAIDRGGNIYVSDTGNGAVKVYNPAGTLLTTVTGYNSPFGVAVDSQGNLLTVDQGATSVLKSPVTGGYTISSELPAGLSFDKNTGVISGTPTAISPVTVYTITGYNIAGSANTTVTISCVLSPPVLSYTPPNNSYLPNTTITPLVPANTGSPLSAMTFNAGTQVTGATLNSPYGVGTDASGNIYVTNSGSGTISKFNSAGVYQSTFSSGFTTPVGIVFDSSGNAYVIDRGTNNVYKITPAGVKTTIITGVTSLRGIAIDASNKLYITSGGGNRIYEYSTAGALLTTLPTINTAYPSAVAVDASGNIYVLDRTNGNVVKFSSAGVYTGVFASGFNTAYGLSIDAAGNVYVADSGNNQIDVYNAAGTSLSTITTNLNTPYGLVTDNKGNIYVADNGNTRVYTYTVTGNYSITPGLPAGFTFNTSTGAITGTTTTTFPAATFTVSASNSAGTGSTTVTLACYLYNDWIGGTSSDWNTPGNWSANIVPGSTDTAKIGVNSTFTNAPVISSAGPAIVNVGTIILGNAKNSAVGITVNSGYTLKVKGDITKQSDAKSYLNNPTYLAGGGTIKAANINIISDYSVSPTSYTEVLNSSVANLNITGNITLTSKAVAIPLSPASVYNATFNLTGGITSVGGVLQTNNIAGSTSTFTVSPTTTATLQLANVAPLSGLSAVGTNVVTFNNTGATVEYSGAAQPVYTDAAITGLPGGVTYQNIKFSGTGIKTAGTGNLTIRGDFTNTLSNDAANYADFTVPAINFSGTTQNLAGGSGNGSTFYTVNFSGAGTKTITSGNIHIASTGTLTMVGSNPATVLAAGGNLTLNSDVNGTATIPAINGPQITGNVNAQRFITGGAVYRGYRLISSPVSQAKVGANNVYSINYLQNSSFLTGSAGGGFDKTGNPTLYLFREDLTPSNASFTSGNFWGISAINNTPNYNYYLNGTATTYNIPTGNGVLFFFRGDRNAPGESLASETLTNYIPTNTTLTATGTLNQGPVTVANWYTPASTNLAYTGTGTGTNYKVRGFNLVGNPYASSIDWDKLDSVSVATDAIYGLGVSRFIYVLDPVSKNYSVYMSGMGGAGTISSVGSNVIPSGQGFYVIATRATGQLVFNESAKINTQANAATGNLFLGAPPKVAVNQFLNLKLLKDSVNADGIFIVFKGDASLQYKQGEDAIYKTGNGTASLASFSADDVSLAINTLSLPKKEGMTIGINVNANVSGAYQLNMAAIKSIPDLFDIWLKDDYIKDSLDIKHNPTYSFNINRKDAASYSPKRFSLIIRQNPALGVHLLNFAAAKISNSAQLTWKTENEANYTNFTVERSIDNGKTFEVVGGFASNDLGTYSLADTKPAKAANQYRLKLEDLNGDITYSKVATLMFGPPDNTITKNDISIYPNPARTVINLSVPQSNNNPLYNIQIVNNTGSVIKTVTSSQPTWQGDVSSLLPGTYILRVINKSDNSLVGRSTFVKL